MHNVATLTGGANTCTLQVHPDDAAELGLTDAAKVRGPGGELIAPVELTADMRRGVVSLPPPAGRRRRRQGPDDVRSRSRRCCRR